MTALNASSRMPASLDSLLGKSAFGDDDHGDAMLSIDTPSVDVISVSSLPCILPTELERLNVLTDAGFFLMVFAETKTDTLGITPPASESFSHCRLGQGQSLRFMLADGENDDTLVTVGEDAVLQISHEWTSSGLFKIYDPATGTLYTRVEVVHTT